MTSLKTDTIEHMANSLTQRTVDQVRDIAATLRRKADEIERDLQRFVDRNPEDDRCFAPLTATVARIHHTHAWMTANLNFDSIFSNAAEADALRTMVKDRSND